MHTIGVLVHSITEEYSSDILSGITDYFRDRNVRVIISQVKNPHCTKGLYDYQNWSGTEFLFSEQVEGIIVIAGGFTSQIPIDELSYYLDAYSSGQPMVSLGAELSLPNSYNIKINCETAYDNVIKHLKKQHKCQRIAFFSALNIHSLEAQERYDAFKNSMEKNKMPFDEESFFDGDFTTQTAYEVISEKFISKDDFPFDAVVASNDLMAIGCIAALENLGLNVPDDVKIIGYDNTSKSFLHSPRLSTIDQKLFDQGRLAAQLLLKKIKNPERHIPKISSLDAIPIYRQSCGCIPLVSSDAVYKDSKDRIRWSKTDNERHMNTNEKYYNILSEVDTFNNIFDMVNSSNTLDVFSYTLKFILNATQMKSMFISFYDEPKVLRRNDVFVMPTTMKSSIYLDQDTETRVYNKRIEYNPKKILVPDEYFDKKDGIYIYHPVFSGEKNYGYLVCRIDNDYFAINFIFLKIIINAVTQAYEYTHTIDENRELQVRNEQLRQDNTDLSLLAKTDELTGLLNRKGFMDLGQRSIDIALDMNAPGLVFFADLDGLKTINDTYGHKMGDSSIKTMAKILSMALRSNDIVGRLSGDEFAIIAVGMTYEREAAFIEKINKLCQEISEKKKFPFRLSCSFGAAEFNSQNSSLKDLLVTADERLYIEKRKKKNLQRN